ncbi:hypothetical protein HHK36_016294 [Tetracentron sinense]|uniref:DC1 domain-containing protein n=1 Tax=Tetracentron sinense TaxID=13715 RepID=A0A835DBT7_TETSI|nr:hypothetical protein HHK36_016294 [Tetracentron sinense]
MKPYAIILIVCASAITAILILICLCKGGRKKKDISHPKVARNQQSSHQVYRDVERGAGTKSGGMVIMTGAAAVLATTAVKSIQHFTHSGHPLIEIYDANKFVCGGCKTPGFGTRYRCDACDFDLHEHCSNCPINLSSYMHPLHPLTLVVRKPQASRQKKRFCDLCHEDVAGLFYKCELCDFDLHPLCTQLPQNVRHVADPQHLLTLLPSSPSWCTICRGLCTSWRYKCGPCGVHLHRNCVLAPPEIEIPSTSSSTSSCIVADGSVNGAQGSRAKKKKLIRKIKYGLVKEAAVALSGMVQLAANIKTLSK